MSNAMRRTSPQAKRLDYKGGPKHKGVRVREDFYDGGIKKGRFTCCKKISLWGGWMGGWMGIKAVSRIAYSDQKQFDNAKERVALKWMKTTRNACYANY